MQLPRHAFDVHHNGRLARLRLREHPLVDTFQVGGPLAIAAQVNIDVRWDATSEPIVRGEGTAADPLSSAAFLGNFAEARSSGWASGIETGFGFKTDKLTAADFFAELGPERNGVFLNGNG